MTMTETEHICLAFDVLNITEDIASSITHSDSASFHNTCVFYV